MNNLITYKEGYSNLSSNESWENTVETGGRKISEVNYSFKRKRTNYRMDWIYLSWTNRRFNITIFENGSHINMTEDMICHLYFHINLTTI